MDANSKKVITELGATTIQSSQWSGKWGGKNAAIDSKTGFYNAKEEKGKEFWISTIFPDHDVYEIHELIFQKIDHDCCRQETLDGFHVSYFYQDAWHDYKDGELIKTGQMPSDEAARYRTVEFNPPIKASMVKLLNKRNDRSSNDAQGRLDFVVTGPVEKNTKPKAPADAVKALSSLGSKTKQSSSWSDDWGGAKASALDSNTGFYNKDSDNDKEFWIKTYFPKAQIFEVHQLVLKKIVHNCCGQKTMDGFVITYFNGSDWVKYNEGHVVKTHQLPEDDPEYERIIAFDPPLKASEFKMTNPREERSHGSAQGRFDLLVTGPIADPEKEAREADKEAKRLKEEQEAAEKKKKKEEEEAAKKAAEEKEAAKKKAEEEEKKK